MKYECDQGIWEWGNGQVKYECGQGVWNGGMDK